MSEDQPEYLFTYGTLMRGFRVVPEWPDRVRARFAGAGQIQARLFDLGQYAAALPAESEQVVTRGEVFELTEPESAKALLDVYEGCQMLHPHQSLYLRKIVPVTMDDGRKLEAWVYFYNRPLDASARRIASGDFRQK